MGSSNEIQLSGNLKPGDLDLTVYKEIILQASIVQSAQNQFNARAIALKNLNLVDYETILIKELKILPNLIQYY